MSLLAADGHVALFVTDEGDARQLPLVCWRDNGTAVHGMVLYRGALRQAEQVPGFRRYAGPLEHDTPAPLGYVSGYPLESDTLVRRGNVSFSP